jgi:hypothetical protein
VSASSGAREPSPRGRLRSAVVGLAIPCLLGVVSAGCANGPDYSVVTIDAPGGGSGDLVVLVQDRRQPVVLREKVARWVGTLRGGFGIPSDWFTITERGMVEDMAKGLCQGLSNAGFHVIPATASPQEEPAQVHQRLAEAGRVLHVILTDWRNDSHLGIPYTTTMFYDLAAVLVVDGQVVADQARAAGEEGLGADFWNPRGHAERVCPEFWKQTMERLLRDPGLQEALR